MPNPVPVSPLRYPGGKALLTEYIANVLEAHLLTGCSFYEPYLGGASVSLGLLGKGCISRAVWVERDPLIYAFWHTVLFDPDGLCSAIEDLEITIETWRDFQRYRVILEPENSQFTLSELGLAGLFFNRTNFSGIIGAGPIGGRNQSSKYCIDCRFNKPRLIEQIQSVSSYSDLIDLHYGDAIGFMRHYAEKISTGFNFVYIDPPYYSQGKKLYRYFYEDQHHIDLARFIGEQGYPWLVSYDDHPRIHELYAQNRIQPIYLDYNVKSSRRATELLISNIEIPPPIYFESRPNREEETVEVALVN
ncbi:MAG: DNA adenine methylase [Sulfuricella sp.]|nr:DNA adenine methylase [Sulfuricella sp.]